MDTYTDPAVRTAVAEHIAANEAYRRCAARDLVETFLDPEGDEYDVEAVIDGLLEAAPYEREFNDIGSQGFWEFADQYRMTP